VINKAGYVGDSLVVLGTGTGTVLDTRLVGEEFEGIGRLHDL